MKKEMQIDPFTRTPGVAGTAMIETHYAEEVITNFSSEISSKFVYKIVGLRGSGKSVEYSKILNYFSKKKDWLVYSLSAAGNPIETLIANLSSEKKIGTKQVRKVVNTGAEIQSQAKLMNFKAKVNVSKEYEKTVFVSDESALTQLIQNASNKDYKILIGVDDISKTHEMVRFLSILGTMLLDAKKNVYFVCTGLSKNIEDFSSEVNLTFFKRSDSIEIKSLDKFDIATKYQELLNVSEEISVKMSKFVKGYAYAYQVLGSLYFKKSEEATFESLYPAFDKIMFQDSYDLIWNSLTEAEKEMVKAILLTSGKTSEIKEKMNNPANYDSLRDRLLKKHLIETKEHGYIEINLPRFKEYVCLWCD